MNHDRRNAPQGNRILRQLSAVERRLLAAETESAALMPGEVLCRVGEKVTHVYFPRQGFVSLFAATLEGPDVGVGLIRTDGMVGIGAAAGASATSELLAVSQGSGQGDRIEIRPFLRLLRLCPNLERALFVYAHRASVQLAQNIACVAIHSARQRVARWMLDAAEAAREPGFSSTQSAIATALALQRPSVSRAAAELQQSGLIRYVRGEVTVLDGPALETVACRCSIRFAAGR